MNPFAAIAVKLGIAIGAWFVWRPLSGVFVLFAIGGFARHLAFKSVWAFFPRRTAVILGTIYGAFVACVVRFGMLVWGIGWFSSIGLGILGLLTVGYLDFGLSGFETEKQQIAGAVGFAVYIALSLALFLIPGVSPYH